MLKFSIIVITTGVLILGSKGLMGQEQERRGVMVFENPEHAKLPDETENIEITGSSPVEDMLKSINYNYAHRDFDKAIELGEAALEKTDDQQLVGLIDFSLSSCYLEKGIQAHMKIGNDGGYWRKSIEYAQKALDVYPQSWQALANIGSAYTNMKKWEQADEYFIEAQKHLNGSDPSFAAIEMQRQFVLEMRKKERQTP